MRLTQTITAHAHNHDHQPAPEPIYVQGTVAEQVAALFHFDEIEPFDALAEDVPPPSIEWPSELSTISPKSTVTKETEEVPKPVGEHTDAVPEKPKKKKAARSSASTKSNSTGRRTRRALALGALIRAQKLEAAKARRAKKLKKANRQVNCPYVFTTYDWSQFDNFSSEQKAN